MFTINSKTKLAENTYEIKIAAPVIARKAKPGQFIILRIDETGERIPLTIADYDTKEITIVFMAVGYTTKQLATLNVGDTILDLVGPLGNPSEIQKFGTIVLVGGGCGLAPVYPQAKELKRVGNKVIIISGFRTKELVFWEEKMQKVCDELIITTDDGSYGKKGFAAQALKEVLTQNEIKRVIIIGPPIMMKFTSEITREKKIPTIVSINSIMVDGIGMCGACRVSVDGKTKFACVDGPEFDAHKIDFDQLINRNMTYSEEEKSISDVEHKKCY